MQAENEGAEDHAELPKIEPGAWRGSCSHHRSRFETRTGRDILNAYSPVEAMRILTIE
jgi:hypothetical protein